MSYYKSIMVFIKVMQAVEQNKEHSKRDHYLITV